MIAVLAYLGPGGALSVLGTGLALLAALVLAFLGLIWYPARRAIRWWRERAARRRASV